MFCDDAIFSVSHVLAHLRNKYFFYDIFHLSALFSLFFFTIFIYLLTFANYSCEIICVISNKQVMRPTLGQILQMFDFEAIVRRADSIRWLPNGNPSGRME